MTDITPICERCGKIAPIDKKMSKPNWTVYRVEEPCECGGKYKMRFMVGDKMLEGVDKLR